MTKCSTLKKVENGGHLPIKDQDSNSEELGHDEEQNQIYRLVQYESNTHP